MILVQFRYTIYYNKFFIIIKLLKYKNTILKIFKIKYLYFTKYNNFVYFIHIKNLSSKENYSILKLSYYYFKFKY